MSVLVIGAAGFLGARLCSRLNARGIEVVGADLQPDQRPVAARNIARLDVTRLHEVLRILKANRDIQAVVLVAALLGEAAEDPYGAVAVNELGMINVLEATQLAGIKRVVYASSISVYGADPSVFGSRPVTEDDYCPPAGLSTYALTKLHNEHMARIANERKGQEVVGLRINGVLGPDRTSGVAHWLASFISLPAAGRPAHIPHGPGVEWPLIYANDAAEAFARLAVADRLDFRIYNSGGFSATTAQLAEAVAAAIPGATVTYEAVTGDPVNTSGGAQTTMVSRIDGTRLATELNWQPLGLADSISAHLAEVRGPSS